jgi:SNF2 family DNA or RNA helicase
MKGLIVAPASLLIVWKRYIEEWLNNKPLIFHGTKKKLEKLIGEFVLSDDTILITSYETLRSSHELLKGLKFDFMVCDEAHRLRNYQTQQSKVVYKVGSRAKHRYILTGTPISNNPSDLYGLFKFLYPKLFTSYWYFVDQYLNTKDNFFGGKEILDLKRPKELKELMYLFGIERKQKDVIKWLPTKTYIKLPVSMEGNQLKYYNEMLKNFETQEIDAPSVLAQLTRLRQICTCPSVLDLDCKNAKEEALFEWIANNPNENILIFSNFTSYLKELSDKLSKKYKIGLIHGQISNRERQNVVDRFQLGELKILLINIISGGAGLTLDNGSVCIFLDRDYNPSNNEQAEARIIPTDPSKVKPISIIDIVCSDSMDEHINDLIQKKLSTIEIINNIKKLL